MLSQAHPPGRPGRRCRCPAPARRRRRARARGRPARRLLARADAPPRLRPGRRHHPDAHARSASRRAAPPRRRSPTSCAGRALRPAASAARRREAARPARRAAGCTPPRRRLAGPDAGRDRRHAGDPGRAAEPDGARVVPLHAAAPPGTPPPARRRRARDAHRTAPGGRRPAPPVRAAPEPAPAPAVPSRRPARRAAEHAAGALRAPSGSAALADALAFLRRRLTGDYEVDEFGFDPELTDNVVLPAAAAARTRSGSGSRSAACENIPADGGALVVANHSGTVPLDALMTDGRAPRRPPGAPAPAAARRRPGLPAAGRRRAGPQGGTTLACNEDAERLLQRRRAGRRLARGLQGHRQAVRRALQAAAVRPRRLRLGGAAHRRADHPVLDRRRRGDLPADRQRPAAGPAARPALLPDHAVFPLLGPLGAGPAAVEVAHRVRRADPHRRATTPAPPTTRCWSSTSPTRCARRSSRRSTACSAAAAPVPG